MAGGQEVGLAGVATLAEEHVGLEVGFGVYEWRVGLYEFLEDGVEPFELVPLDHHLLLHLLDNLPRGRLLTGDLILAGLVGLPGDNLIVLEEVDQVPYGLQGHQRLLLKRQPFHGVDLLLLDLVRVVLVALFQQVLLLDHVDLLDALLYLGDVPLLLLVLGLTGGVVVAIVKN